MMLEYAPVDCDTGAPLPDGYISKDVIYSGGTKPGWGWNTYSAQSQTYAVDGERADVEGGWDTERAGSAHTSLWMPWRLRYAQMCEYCKYWACIVCWVIAALGTVRRAATVP